MKIVKYIVVLSILCCGGTSCEDFIEIDPPSNQLSSEVVFKDVSTAEAFLAEIYAKLRDKSVLSGNTSGAYYTLSLYLDDLKNNNPQYTTEQNLFTNNVLATDTNIKSIWDENYYIIYLYNRFLEGMENSSISESKKKEMMGQVLYLRSHIYYYLSKLYGAIPYTITTNYQINKQLPKLEENQLFPQLIADLHTAEELLAETKMTYNKTKASYWTTQVLLSKIYLEVNEYEKALYHSREVINGPFSIEEVSNKFLKNSASTIFHFKPSHEGVSTHEGRVLIFSSVPPPSISLTDDLINSFEYTDQRRIHWVKEMSNESQTYYHSYKYKQNQPLSTSQEYSIVVRIEESYYLAIEALLKSGNHQEALHLWNQLRTVNGLSEWTTTPSDAITQLLLDKRREFFCENGNRFCDVKRNHLLNEIMSSKKSTWQTHHKVWPIPMSELLLNSNLLPQNEGY